MRLTYRALPALLAVACAVPAPGPAAPPEPDWPQWRGPERDGRSPETGLLPSWPEAGPPLEWTAEGLGAGLSTVAVVGDRIFTMGQDETHTHAICLARDGGEVLWRKRIGRAGGPGWGDFEGPRSTPTVDGERVYALGQYGELVCLEAASGDTVWKKSLQEDLGGPRPEWGFSESLLVDGDRLICTPGGPRGTLAALDKRTGDVLWRSEGIDDTAQYASVIRVEHDGDPQYVQLTMESIFGVASISGELQWRADWPGETAVIPTPVWHEGRVYVTSGYGVGCNLFRVEDDGAEGLYGDEARKWMKNQHGGVVLVGGHVYGYSDGVGWACQELSTGELVWNEKGKLGKGSVAYADGHLYLRSEKKDGTVVLIEATPEGWKEKGRFDPPRRSEKHSWPHPVVAGGRLYLRDQDVLLCYDVRAR